MADLSEPTEAQLREAERLAAGRDGGIWGHDDGAVRLQVGDEHWRIQPDGESKPV